MADDDDRAEWKQLLADEVECLVAHEALTATGEKHRVVDDKVWTISAQGFHNRLNDFYATHHANLYGARLHIVDKSIDLSTYNTCRQVMKLLNAECVLKGDSRDGGSCICCFISACKGKEKSLEDNQ